MDGANEVGIYEDEINMFVDIMDRYKLSSTFCALGPWTRDSTLAIVKKDKWNYTLSDDTLTETGLLIKKVITKNYTSYVYNEKDYTLHEYANADRGIAFWLSPYKEKIIKIKTSNTVNIPDNCIRVWDLSYGSGKILGFIENADDGNYIATVANYDGNIYTANKWRIFKNFSNLEEIDISYLNTINTQTMAEWFSGCSKLKNIAGIENINTENVEDMRGMFAQCQSLEQLDLKRFDTSKVKDMSSMFVNCQGIKKLDLSSFSMSNVSNMSFMFRNCNSLEEIDLTNASFGPEVNANGMFSGVKDGVTIYVKDVQSAQFIQERLEDSNVNGVIYYKAQDEFIEYN